MARQPRTPRVQTAPAQENASVPADTLHRANDDELGKYADASNRMPVKLFVAERDDRLDARVSRALVAGDTLALGALACVPALRQNGCSGRPRCAQRAKGRINGARTPCYPARATRRRQASRSNDAPRTRYGKRNACW
ncbi:hypothetical protein ERJ75_000174000 [Trypanosoma vivax]|nr:hypothetical protein ERJ75_000174000 [Trypanosoma vivax]